MTKKEFVIMYCMFNDSHYMDHSRTLQYAEEMAVILDDTGYFKTDDDLLHEIRLKAIDR